MQTPYNRTATSRARAEDLDASGASALRRADVLYYLGFRGARGATTKEYAESLGYNSLPTWVTGLFSTLHADGEIARIAERRPEGRGASYVYVLPDLRLLRDEVPYRSNKGITSADRAAFRWAIEQIEAAQDSGKSLGNGWLDLRDRLKGLL